MNEQLTAPQAAELLGVDRTTVARLIRQRKLPATKFANRWVIDPAALSRFAQDYEARPGRPTGWSPKKEDRE